MLTATPADERCILEMGDIVAIRMLEEIRGVKGSSYFVQMSLRFQEEEEEEGFYKSFCQPTQPITCANHGNQQRLPQKITLRAFVPQFPVKLPLSVFHMKHVLASFAT